MRLLLLVVLLGVCGCLASRDQIPTALANPTARVIAGISADTSTAELNDAVDELQTRAAAEAMGYMFPKQAMDEPVLNQKDLPENADHATGTWRQREKQNMQKLQTIADMARTSSFLQVSEEAEEADDLTADDLKAVEEAEEDLKNSKDGDDDDISLGAANADVPADLPLSTPKHVHRHRFHAPKASEANDLSDAELDSLIKGSGVDAKAVEEDAKKMSEAEVEKALQAAEKAPVPTAAAAAPAQAPKAAVAPSQPASAVAAPAKAPVTTAPAVAAKAPTKAATAAPAPSSPSVTDLIGGALKNSPVMKQAAAEIPADQLKIHQEMDDELKALNDVLGQAEQLVEPVKKAADVIKAESLKVTDTAKQLKAVVDDATKDIPAVSDKELNSILGLGKDGKATKETKKAEAAAPKAPEVPTAVVEDIMGGNDASFKAAPKSAPVPADQDDDFADGLMSRADVLASNLNLVASSPIHLAASLDFASSAEKAPSKAGAEEDPDLPINGVAKAASKLRMGQVTSDNSNSSAPAVDTNGDPVLVLTSHPQDVENNLKGTTMLRFNKTAGDAAKGISVYNKASVGDILKENNVTLPAKPAHIIRSDKYGANPKGCGAGQANANCSSAAFDSKPTIHDTPTEIVAKVTRANPLPVAPNPSTLMSPKPLLVPQYEDASQRKESLAPFDVPTAGYTFTGSEHVVEFGSKLAPPVPGAIPVSADGKPLTPAPKHVPVPLPADKGHVKWKSGSGQTVLSPSVGNTIPSFKVGETYLKPTQA